MLVPVDGCVKDAGLAGIGQYWAPVLSAPAYLPTVMKDVCADLVMKTVAGVQQWPLSVKGPLLLVAAAVAAAVVEQDVGPVT